MTNPSGRPIHLGDIAIAQGSNQSAKKYLDEALSIVEAWHLTPAALHLCVSFADLSEHQGDDQQATKLLRLAVRHHVSMFETKEAAKRRLGHSYLATMKAGLEHGEALTLEAVIREINSS